MDTRSLYRYARLMRDLWAIGNGHGAKRMRNKLRGRIVWKMTSGSYERYGSKRRNGR